VLIASAQEVATGAAQASKGLENVKDNFTILAKSLDDSVQTLSQKIAELLDDYSERVKNQTVQRMTTWNEQTNQYISSMTDAVRALNDVVDEIDGKISSANHRARD
jgi:methyl-accepting chemotaxis protein